jgi:hypothetical protein
MSKRGNLSHLMSQRTPLAQREVVEPVDMYTNPQVDKTTVLQADKDTGGQVDTTINQHTTETIGGQNHKKAKPLVEKYTTHLRPETIKAIKRAALESDRKDYEVVQAALDEYLSH